MRSTRPSAIVGAVREDGSSAPIGGAHVAVLRTSDFAVVDGVIADSQGGFVSLVRPGAYYLYAIDPSGQHLSGFFGAPTSVSVTAGNASAASPGLTSLRGSVAAAVTETGTGAAIPGVWGLALATGVGNTGAVEQVVTGDGAGRVTVGGLRPGSHFFGYVDPTGAHATRFYPSSPDVPGSTPVNATAAATTTADATLPAQSIVGTGAAITGVVTEQGTGVPVAGARVVALRASDYRLVRGAITDAFGAYSLDLEPGAGYKLAVFDSAGNHDMEWFNDLPSTGLASAVTVNAPATADAALEANIGSIAGTIVDDPSGDPIAGAWVIAIGPTGIAGGAVTAADGSYTIAGLAPGTYRATFVDPKGGRDQEYWDNSSDYAEATVVNVTAATTATVNAGLALP